LYIADAMAMPTHWYYGGSSQIARDYGGLIQGYTTPKTQLQGSIMNKSSTGGGGRGSDQGEIIGNVINHGKKQYWTARGSYHYHCTLQKGENTLEATLTRLVCKSITENQGRFVADDLRQRYIKFMTTEGSHNDCYASTCHRMFFANLTRGLAPERCPDNDGHNVDTIDGLIMAVPVALATCQRSLAESQQETANCTKVTRNSSELPRYADNLAAMLRDLVAGSPMIDVLKSKAGQGMDRIVQSASRSSDPVVA
jgi:ADP-ribosylglycohydrolase